MKKCLIVCFDGTWNTPDQEENGTPAPTNVFKIYNAIADFDVVNKICQLKFYHPGVGSDGGWLKSVLGGAIGAGISKNIRNAYHWIGSNYEENDELFLFGFSRGAFAARSLAGFLKKGLLDLRDIDPDESWARVRKAYAEGYRVEKSKIGDWAKGGWRFFHQGNPVPIHFIGVWETVGSLGVPDDLEFLDIFEQKEKWEFHDTALGEHVQTARHAMAIDEVRSSFSVTRWSNGSSHQDCKEVWFPGVHSDVGGGYVACDLSNGALLWMMEESQGKGLCFTEGVKDGIKSNAQGVIHNSYKGVFSKLRSRPRNVCAITQENSHMLHESVLARMNNPPIDYGPYHRTKILAVDESYSVHVFANERWNYAGVYLPSGHEFVFSAVGKWLDSKESCDWKGTQDDNLTLGDINRAVSSFLGNFETIYKEMSKNASADFWLTKRVENMPWFTLVGAVANDSGLSDVVGKDGSAKPHQYIELANFSTMPIQIDTGGYLYCFPNDVWSMYDNNHGSVLLTITRTA